MEDSIVLSAEQGDALSAMMSGRNMFLTGEAARASQRLFASSAGGVGTSALSSHRRALRR